MVIQNACGFLAWRGNFWTSNCQSSTSKIGVRTMFAENSRYTTNQHVIYIKIIDISTLGEKIFGYNIYVFKRHFSVFKRHFSVFKRHFSALKRQLDVLERHTLAFERLLLCKVLRSLIESSTESLRNRNKEESDVFWEAKPRSELSIIFYENVRL